MFLQILVIVFLTGALTFLAQRLVPDPKVAQLLQVAIGVGAAIAIVQRLVAGRAAWACAEAASHLSLTV